MLTSVFRPSALSGGGLDGQTGFSGTSEPLAERPDVVGKAGGHGRRPRLPSSLAFDPQRPHGPAEVVAVRHEIAGTVVHPLAPREAITLPPLPPVLLPLRRVVPL